MWPDIKVDGHGLQAALALQRHRTRKPADDNRMPRGVRPEFEPDREFSHAVVHGGPDPRKRRDAVDTLDNRPSFNELEGVYLFCHAARHKRPMVQKCVLASQRKLRSPGQPDACRKRAQPMNMSG